MQVSLHAVEQIYLPIGAKDESEIIQDDVIEVWYGPSGSPHEVYWSSALVWSLTTEGPPRLVGFTEWVRM